jgi:hypothetical protein
MLSQIIEIKNSFSFCLFSDQMNKEEFIAQAPKDIWNTIINCARPVDIWIVYWTMWGGGVYGYYIDEKFAREEYEKAVYKNPGLKIYIKKENIKHAPSF